MAIIVLHNLSKKPEDAQSDFSSSEPVTNIWNVP